MQNGSSLPNDRQVVKSFVRENGRAAIVCPECKKVKNISVDRFTERKTRLKARCSCGASFEVQLDYRRSYRKPTSLVGTYYLFTPATGASTARIKNISFDGICLEVDTRGQLREGQRGVVDFILDDKKRTQIRREFSIQSVGDRHIGCEFKKDQAFDKALGFYLRPGL